jgi:predicted phosphate transport protein (TIGR00153 family)
LYKQLKISGLLLAFRSAFQYHEVVQIMFKIFQSNDGVFYQLLEDAAENNVKAAKLLNQLCKEYKDPEQIAELIHNLENDGDKIAHKVFFEINKSFMTPIDREDLIDMIHALDDVLDYIDESASGFDTYQVKKSTKFAEDMSLIILQAAEIINQALPKLRNRKLFPEVEKAIVEINRLENEADILFKAGLKSLYKNTKDPIDIMRLQAIYTTMEDATDSCERIASLLRGFTIKYA